MKLGFLTACLPDRSLTDIGAWAADNAFEALEVAAWPALGDRPFTASHIDVEKLDASPTPRPRTSRCFPERRTRYGWPGRAVERPDPWDVGWWRYRVPGLGQVDWTRVVDTLYEGGFDHVLSVEHEDPVWGGTEERIETGLRVAHRTLRPLIVADPAHPY